MLAVASHHQVRFGGASRRVDELTASLPARAWQCVSAGTGAKGHRLYEVPVVARTVAVSGCEQFVSADGAV